MTNSFVINENLLVSNGISGYRACVFIELNRLEFFKNYWKKVERKLLDNKDILEEDFFEIKDYIKYWTDIYKLIFKLKYG